MSACVWNELVVQSSHTNTLRRIYARTGPAHTLMPIKKKKKREKEKHLRDHLWRHRHSYRKCLSWYHVLYGSGTPNESSTLLCQGVLNPLCSCGFNCRASPNIHSHAIHIRTTMGAKLPVSKTDCWLTHNTYVKQTLLLYCNTGGEENQTLT